MPHATTRGHPPDLGAEPQQEHERQALPQPLDADPAGDPPGKPDDRRREGRIDPGLELVRGHGTGDRDQGHQRDRRERPERDIHVPVPSDHVQRAEGDVDPGVPVEEGVGEVEQVASSRVVRAVRQPVHDKGDERHHQADDGRPTRPGGNQTHGRSVASRRRWAVRRFEQASRSDRVATSAR